MEIKLTAEANVTPFVDETTGKIAIINNCTTPYSLKFRNKDEQLSFAVSILRAIEKNHNVVTFNGKEIDIAAFTEDFKEDKPKHDENEEIRIPRLVGKE